MIQEFPRLMWTKDGREVTVQTADEKAAVLKDGGRSTQDGRPDVEKSAPEPDEDTKVPAKAKK